MGLWLFRRSLIYRASGATRSTVKARAMSDEQVAEITASIRRHGLVTAAATLTAARFQGSDASSETIKAAWREMLLLIAVESRKQP